MTVTRSSGTDNSSAAICAIAVWIPVPRSTLPEKTVTLPFESIARNPSTWSPATVLAGIVGDAAPPSPTVKLTTSAPLVLRNARRDSLVGSEFRFVMAVSSRHLLGRALDGADDAQVRAAATKVLGERSADLLLGRIACGLQERGGLHDHAVDAIAALHRLLVDERLLQRVRLRRRSETFERHEFLPRGGRHRHGAGTHGLAVEVHRARAALTQPAAEARSMHPEVIAQRIEQRHLRIVGRDGRRLAVEIEVDLHGPLLVEFCAHCDRAGLVCKYVPSVSLGDYGAGGASASSSGSRLAAATQPTSRRARATRLPRLRPLLR